MSNFLRSAGQKATKTAKSNDKKDSPQHWENIDGLRTFRQRVQSGHQSKVQSIATFLLTEDILSEMKFSPTECGFENKDSIHSHTRVLVATGGEESLLLRFFDTKNMILSQTMTIKAYSADVITIPAYGKKAKDKKGKVQKEEAEAPTANALDRKTVIVREGKNAKANRDASYNPTGLINDVTFVFLINQLYIYCCSSNGSVRGYNITNAVKTHLHFHNSEVTDAIPKEITLECPVVVVGEPTRDYSIQQLKFLNYFSYIDNGYKSFPILAAACRDNNVHLFHINPNNLENLDFISYYPEATNNVAKFGALSLNRNTEKSESVIKDGTLTGHQDWVTSVLILKPKAYKISKKRIYPTNATGIANPDPLVVISGGYDGNIFIWTLAVRPQTDKKTKSIQGENSGNRSSSAEFCRKLEIHGDSVVFSLAYLDREEAIICSGDEDGRIFMWPLNSIHSIIRTFDLKKLSMTKEISNQRFDVNCLSVYDVDAGLPPLLIAGSDDEKVYVFSIDTGEVVRTLQGHTNYVYKMATFNLIQTFENNRRCLLPEGDLRQFDLEEQWESGNDPLSIKKRSIRKLIQMQEEKSLKKYEISAFSYFEPIIFSIEGNSNEILVWNLHSKDELTNIEFKSSMDGHKSDIRCIHYLTKDSNAAGGPATVEVVLTSADDGTVRFYSISSRKMIYRLSDPDLIDPALSLKEQNKIGGIAHKGGVNVVTSYNHRDGRKYLVTCGFDGNVKIWLLFHDKHRFDGKVSRENACYNPKPPADDNDHTGQLCATLLASFVAHQGEITDMCIFRPCTPVGNFQSEYFKSTLDCPVVLVTCSTDRSVKCWDLDLMIDVAHKKRSEADNSEKPLETNRETSMKRAESSSWSLVGSVDDSSKAASSKLAASSKDGDDKDKDKDKETVNLAKYEITNDNFDAFMSLKGHEDQVYAVTALDGDYVRDPLIISCTNMGETFIWKFDFSDDTCESKSFNLNLGNNDPLFHVINLNDAMYPKDSPVYDLMREDLAKRTGKQAPRRISVAKPAPTASTASAPTTTAPTQAPMDDIWVVSVGTTRTADNSVSKYSAEIWNPWVRSELFSYAKPSDRSKYFYSLGKDHSLQSFSHLFVPITPTAVRAIRKEPIAKAEFEKATTVHPVWQHFDVLLVQGNTKGQIIYHRLTFDDNANAASNTVTTAPKRGGLNARSLSSQSKSAAVDENDAKEAINTDDDSSITFIAATIDPNKGTILVSSGNENAVVMVYEANYSSAAYNGFKVVENGFPYFNLDKIRRPADEMSMVHSSFTEIARRSGQVISFALLRMPPKVVRYFNKVIDAKKKERLLKIQRSMTGKNANTADLENAIKQLDNNIQELTRWLWLSSTLMLVGCDDDRLHVVDIFHRKSSVVVTHTEADATQGQAKSNEKKTVKHEHFHFAYGFQVLNLFQENFLPQKSKNTDTGETEEPKVQFDFDKNPVALIMGRNRGRKMAVFELYFNTNSFSQEHNSKNIMSTNPWKNPCPFYLKQIGSDFMSQEEIVGMVLTQLKQKKDQVESDVDRRIRLLYVTRDGKVNFSNEFGSLPSGTCPEVNELRTRMSNKLALSATTLNKKDNGSTETPAQPTKETEGTNNKTAAINNAKKFFTKCIHVTEEFVVVGGSEFFPLIYDFRTETTYLDYDTDDKDKKHSDVITSITSFRPGSHEKLHIVTGSRDKTIRIWVFDDVYSNSVETHFDPIVGLPGEVTSLAIAYNTVDGYSDYGSLSLFGGGDANLRDANVSEGMYFNNHGANQASIYCTEDLTSQIFEHVKKGKDKLDIKKNLHIIAGCIDGSIRVISVDGKVLRVFEPHTKSVAKAKVVSGLSWDPVIASFGTDPSDIGLHFIDCFTAFADVQPTFRSVEVAFKKDISDWKESKKSNSVSTSKKKKVNLFPRIQSLSSKYNGLFIECSRLFVESLRDKCLEFFAKFGKAHLEWVLVPQYYVDPMRMKKLTNFEQQERQREERARLEAEAKARSLARQEIDHYNVDMEMNTKKAKKATFSHQFKEFVTRMVTDIESKYILGEDMVQIRFMNKYKALKDDSSLDEEPAEHLVNYRGCLKSICGICIDSNDVDGLREVNAAIANRLNQNLDNTEHSYEQFYPPGGRIPRMDVVNMAKLFQREFIDFIISLKMVRAHGVVSNNQEMKCVNIGRSGNVLESVSSVRDVDGCWIQVAKKPYGASAGTPALAGGDDDEGDMAGVEVAVYHNRKVRFSLDSIISAAKDKLQDLLWMSKKEDSQPSESSNKQDEHWVTAIFLPLPHIAQFDMLRCFVDASEYLDDVNIFNSDVGIYALRYAWRVFGREIHVKAFVLHLFYAGLYSFSLLAFNDFITSGSSGLIGLAWLLQVLVLVMTLYFVHREYSQYIKTEDNSLMQHFSDIWNLNDAVIYITLLAGTITRCVETEETPVSRCFLALTAVSIYLKILYYLRAFESTGPLVSMIFTIAYDIRYLLFVLFIVIIGFAQAFWIISKQNDELSFGLFKQALLSLFDYMLGNFDSDFTGTSSPNLGVVLYIVFMLIVAILLLNLLIALMGDSFARVKEKGIAQWRLEQASIIVEQECLAPESPVDIFGYETYDPKFVHVLIRSADLKSMEEKDDPIAEIDEKCVNMDAKIEKILKIVMKANVDYVDEEDEEEEEEEEEEDEYGYEDEEEEDEDEDDDEDQYAWDENPYGEYEEEEDNYEYNEEESEADDDNGNEENEDDDDDDDE